MSELLTTTEQRAELRALLAKNGSRPPMSNASLVLAAVHLAEALLADAELAAELESKLWLMQYDKLHHPDEGAIR